MAILGCSHDLGKRPNAVDVQGVVKLANGQPAANILCCFRTTSTLQLPAEYPTNAQGQLEPGTSSKVSLIPGAYRVFIAQRPALKVTDKPVFAKALEQIPAQFKDESNAVLEVTIQADGPFELTLPE